MIADSFKLHAVLCPLHRFCLPACNQSLQLVKRIQATERNLENPWYQ